jgi:hypothetical protein
MAMTCKWIIGASAFLDVACEAWRQACPGLQVERVHVQQDALYQFELGILDALSPEKGTAFIAFDERFGNFKRTELMVAAQARGLRLDAYISPRAMLAADVSVGANTFVADGVIIGSGSRIGSNCVLLPATNIGIGVDVQSSCWLEPGVMVGDGARISARCTLRSGALIAPRIHIGSDCELGWHRRYDADIAEKTVFDPRYDAPIRTYGS